ncbi:hypothetical protein [Absidia glauca]|uniref:ATP-dependent DNA helicase n=1 Tax=Absidia glauca TaxID=4829 RepID=A0A163JE16_ABSGL|nr:hypothetical protein [Absidia glauca]
MYDNDIVSSKLFFVDGPGGTGKTYLFNSLLQRVRQDGSIALAAASSGTAALLLNGGRTAHSMFKVPLDVDDNTTCSIPASSSLATLVRQTKPILWDEASMINRYLFKTVDRTFRNLMKQVDPREEHSIWWQSDCAQRRL